MGGIFLWILQIEIENLKSLQYTTQTEIYRIGICLWIEVFKFCIRDILEMHWPKTHKLLSGSAIDALTLSQTNENKHLQREEVYWPSFTRMKIVIMVKWTCSIEACSVPCTFQLRWLTCKLFVFIIIPPFDKNSLEEIHSHKNQNWNITQEWFERVTMSACPQAENKSTSRLTVELKINLYKHPPPATCHMSPCSHACQSMQKSLTLSEPMVLCMHLQWLELPFHYILQNLAIKVFKTENALLLQFYESPRQLWVRIET